MKKEFYHIYVISNSVNDDLYIGVTSLSLEERFKIHEMHLNSDFSGTEKRSIMYEDMAKFGFDKFKIALLQKNRNLKLCNKIEKEIQLTDPLFKRYAFRDLNRNCKTKFNSCYKFISTDKVLHFKTAVEAAKYFGCSESNVIKSISYGYLFLKKYYVHRITKDEYNNTIGIGSFDF